MKWIQGHNSRICIKRPISVDRKCMINAALTGSKVLQQQTKYDCSKAYYKKKKKKTKHSDIFILVTQTSYETHKHKRKFMFLCKPYPDYTPVSKT